MKHEHALQKSSFMFLWLDAVLTGGGACLCNPLPLGYKFRNRCGVVL